jgi:2'-5' RNA ligase
MIKEVCVVLTIPKPLYSKMYSENKMLHKKYSKYCKSKYPNTDKYFDIPHITLFSMGNCVKHKKEIESKLKEIVKNNSPIEIESKELTLFEKGDLRHLVIPVKNTPELQKLHNDIVNGLMIYSEKKEGYILDKYNPHFSKIINLSKEFSQLAEKDAKIKEFKFTAKNVGLKVRGSDNYCSISKRFKLKNNKVSLSKK